MYKYLHDGPFKWQPPLFSLNFPLTTKHMTKTSLNNLYILFYNASLTSFVCLYYRIVWRRQRNMFFIPWRENSPLYSPVTLTFSCILKALSALTWKEKCLISVVMCGTFWSWHRSLTDDLTAAFSCIFCSFRRRRREALHTSLCCHACSMRRKAHSPPLFRRWLAAGWLFCLVHHGALYVWHFYYCLCLLSFSRVSHQYLCILIDVVPISFLGKYISIP